VPSASVEGPQRHFRGNTWTGQLSKAIAIVVPELVSQKWNISDRAGLARLDYTQNVHNKTLVRRAVADC
jgi:DNA primase